MTNVLDAPETSLGQLMTMTPDHRAAHLITLSTEELHSLLRRTHYSVEGHLSKGRDFAAAEQHAYALRHLDNASKALNIAHQITQMLVSGNEVQR